MSATKLTLGPWRWLSNQALVGDHGRRPVVLSGRELRQCGEDGRLVELDASSPDARLIETAPQMFALLQSLHERLLDGRAEVEKADMDSWAEEIDEVLTAAEGA